MNATSEAEVPRARPRSRTDLFLSFSWMALQGFGGVLAIVQREMVENKRWMTREEFVEEWSVAQIMPGPNVVNLAITVGSRYFGLSGALAAIAGMLVAPLAVVLVAAVVYAQLADDPHVVRALTSMGAAASGLLVATGLKLAPALARNALGIPLCVALVALTFAAVALLRLPLAWVVFGLGGLGCLLAYRKLS